MCDECFSRSAALLGDTAFDRLQQAHVIVIGVGGVGSWCAEALVRTGLGHITLMDDDNVATSNINRQCPATHVTLGRPKVEVMRERLLTINPACEVKALRQRYTAESSLDFNAYDAIVDAIDSLDCKMTLVCAAVASGQPFVSSLGAALRLDPTKVAIGRFDKVAGDGLARAMRQRFKRLNLPFPRFDCVYSTEVPQQSSARSEKGSYMPVTASFGMTLAAHIIRRLTISTTNQSTTPDIP